LYGWPGKAQDKLTFNNVLIFGSVASAAIAFMSGGGILGSLLITRHHAAVTAIITFAVRAAGKTNLRNAAIVATALPGGSFNYGRTGMG
jgi:hypothetical protein